MKKISALALALVLVLSLAACGGGNENEPSVSTTPPPSTSAGTTEELSPKDDTISDTPAPETKDGDFLWAEVASDDKAPEHIASRIWGFRLFFAGDTSGAKGDISDLTLYIDGAGQPCSFNSADWQPYYDSGSNSTTYDFIFDEEFTQKPATYYVEFMLNGIKVRSTSSNWAASGVITYVEDTPLLSEIPSLLSPDTSTPPEISSPPDASPSASGDTIPMPDGFPENPGDAEFFNFQTDDYALAKIVEVITNADQQADSGVMLFCFDADGNTVSVVEKWIMPSESDATALSQTITDRGNWANQFYAIEEHNQIGNVLFLSWGADTIDYYFGTKENVLGYEDVAHKNFSLSDYYFSKP